MAVQFLSRRDSDPEDLKRSLSCLFALHEASPDTVGCDMGTSASDSVGEYKAVSPSTKVFECEDTDYIYLHSYLLNRKKNGEFSLGCSRTSDGYYQDVKSPPIYSSRQTNSNRPYLMLWLP